MQLKAKTRIGCALLAVGIVVSLAAYLRTNALNAVPLSVPITLKPERMQPLNFKPRVSTQHQISIVFDSGGIPFERLDCLIGMADVHVQPCTGSPEVLDVLWEISANNHIVASGSSGAYKGAGYSYRRLERYIGSFDADTGRNYLLTVVVRKDGSELLGAHPLLRVGPNLNGFLGTFILLGFAFYGGILSAILGLSIVLFATYDNRRELNDRELQDRLR
jgi:hypothetical protein